MSETEIHFFSFHIADYERDTDDLSLEQHGAYLVLMKAAYKRRGEPIPLNADVLRICGARTDSEFEAIEFVLNRYFKKSAAGWTHKRVIAVVDAVKRNISSKKQAGKKGAKSRWDKGKNGTCHNSANGKTMATYNLELTTEDNSVGKPTADAPAPLTQKTLDVEVPQTKVVHSPLDLKKELFTRGVHYLVSNGCAEPQARALLGKWRKGRSDADVINALAAAEGAAASEPIPYVQKFLNNRSSVNERTSSKSSKHPLGIFGQIASELRDRTEPQDPERSRPVSDGDD